MGKGTEDGKASGDDGASKQLKDMRLKSAKKLLKELAPEELDDFLIATTEQLAEKDAPDSPGWVHISEYSDEIKEAIKIWGKVGGISTGLPSLDNVIGGLRPGQTYLVAGESNNGKSALVAQIAVNVSRYHKVGYISLEMTPGDNGARINHMNGGSDTVFAIDGMDIYFQSVPSLSAKQLRPLIQAAKDEGMQVVFLDYIQFLGRGMTNEEMSQLSQTLKRLSLEFELPLVVVASLRKSNGGRKWYDITLEDLMGTNAIAYDSDNTIVVSRRNLDDELDDDHVYIKVLKLRHMRRTKDNEFLWFRWNDTRVTEEMIPLHIQRAADRDELPVKDIDELTVENSE